MSLPRLAARPLGIELTDGQLGQFERYRSMLIEWNGRVNLTAITEPGEVERLHFLDSLACLLAPLAMGAVVLDVGAGGGFPGLPLKIARPDVELTLLEATAKKTAFLAAVVSELGLAGARVVTGRAEEFGGRDGFDVVVARALAPLAVLLELTLPFARVGGQVVALKKGVGLSAEVASAGHAAALLGGDFEPPLTYELGDGEARHVMVVRKARPTPAAYPRRTGVPAKRPL